MRRDFGDQGAELCRIGDDEEAPGPRDRGQQPWRRPETEADEQTASAARRHREIDQALTTDPVGHPSSPEATEPPRGDRAERQSVAEPSGVAGLARRRASGQARRQEDRHPGPHRVQLPHMAEIAADGETRRAMAQHPGREVPREFPPLERIGALAIAAPHQRCRCQRRHRRDQDDAAHAGRLEGVDEVRRGLSDRERADDGPDGETPRRAEPGGDHLHRGRIDAREEGAGEEPQRERAAQARRDDQPRVGDRPERRAGCDVGPRGHEVGQIEGGRDGRAGHETQLHRHREPAGLARADAPDRLELRRDRAGGEPERHAQQLRQRHQPQHAPARRVIVHGRLGPCGRGHQKMNIASP